jgi:hypothetical protein
MPRFEDDEVIVGSAFGGSVAVARSAEKGCRDRMRDAGGRRNDDSWPTPALGS